MRAQIQEGLPPLNLCEGRSRGVLERVGNEAPAGIGSGVARAEGLVVGVDAGAVEVDLSCRV